jgi:hypothetical protein
MTHELRVPRIAELRSNLGIVVAMKLIFLRQHGDTDRLILRHANIAVLKEDSTLQPKLQNRDVNFKP